MLKRFRGVFLACKMTTPASYDDPLIPFSDNIYLLAAVLDPSFAMQWVDVDVHIDADAETLGRLKNELKNMLQGTK